jgi:hypothetical protein
MAASQPSPALIASRVGASLLGGYAFAWGFTTLGIALATQAGMPYGDAQTLAFLLAFLVFLGCFLWAFATASLVRAWGVLAGGGGLMTGVAWLMMRNALN